MRAQTGLWDQRIRPIDIQVKNHKINSQIAKPLLRVSRQVRRASSQAAKDDRRTLLVPSGEKLKPDEVWAFSAEIVRYVVRCVSADQLDDPATSVSDALHLREYLGNQRLEERHRVDGDEFETITQSPLPTRRS